MVTLNEYSPRMCGIAGIVSLKEGVSPSRFIVEKMTERIKHRGPDDEGIFEKPNVVLGFRRLSILDLSPLGHQPMTHGPHTIIFNGEIYNYVELREELVKLGHRFLSGTDSEVILHAYAAWGEDCVKRFNGMWAFAIWDAKEENLFCSRDRFGVKPFYYTLTGDEFVFASEIKALLHHPKVSRHPNKTRIYDYLVFGYQDHTPETFFEGIKQIPPSHSMRIKKNKQLTLSRYWDLDVHKTLLGRSTGEYAEQFLNLFRDSIRLRLRSDVPVGTCLSGGLDSSSIVCVVNEFLRSEHPTNIGDRQKTFTAAYDEKDVDEREFSDAVIEKTDAAQYTTFPTGANVLGDLDRVVYHQDEPFGSTSIFAQWFVMQRAAQEGIKVLLDGQGADELLAGYWGYFGSYIASFVKQLRLLRAQQEIIAWKRNHDTLGTHSSYYIMVEIVMKLLPHWLTKVAMSVGGADGRLFLKRHFINRYGQPPPQLKNSYRDPFRNSLHRGLQIGLPALLHFEDRDSMAWSIEARVPFLDYRLVEFIFSLPNNQKIDGGTTKIVLREAMRGILPEKVQMRQSKLGFATPEKTWLKQELRPIIHETIHSTSFADRDIFDVDQVKKLATQASKGHYHRFAQSSTIWRWVNLELWFRKFIDHTPKIS